MANRDPYLNDENAYQRLRNDYLAHNSVIVAVDFDDTIYDFHKKGSTYPRVIRLLKKCNRLNFPVVIFTANEDTGFVRSHCEHIGIKIYGVNENVLKQFNNAGKIYYNILLDDRAGLSTSYNLLSKLIGEIINESIKSN